MPDPEQPQPIPRDAVAIAAGGIPVVLDLREFAQLLAAVGNDTPREQQTEKEIEDYRGAMDVVLRAMRTPWQAHPDALRACIAELLEAVDDLVSGRGLLDVDELERRARALRDLADWAAPGPEHFQLVDGERFPCGPAGAVAAHNADLPQGRPGHPLAVVPDGLRVVPSPEAD
jgi:hypothetical protein